MHNNYVTTLDRRVRRIIIRICVTSKVTTFARLQLEADRAGALTGRGYKNQITVYLDL